MENLDSTIAKLVSATEDMSCKSCGETFDLPQTVMLLEFDSGRRFTYHWVGGSCGGLRDRMPPRRVEELERDVHGR